MDALTHLRQAHAAHMQALSNLRGLGRDIDAQEKPPKLHLRIAHVLRDVQASHAGFVEAVGLLDPHRKCD